MNGDQLAASIESATWSNVWMNWTVIYYQLRLRLRDHEGHGELKHWMETINHISSYARLWLDMRVKG